MNNKIKRKLVLLKHRKLINIIQKYVIRSVHNEIDDFSKSFLHAINIGKLVESYLQARELAQRPGSKNNPKSLTVTAAMEIVNLQFKQKKRMAHLKYENTLLKSSVIHLQKKLGIGADNNENGEKDESKKKLN